MVCCRFSSIKYSRSSLISYFVPFLDAKEYIKEKATGAKDTLAEKTEGAKESIKETAGEAKDYAKETGSNVADRGRGKKQ